jgi:hypothetical protein
MGSEAENVTEIRVQSLSGALLVRFLYADLLSTKKRPNIIRLENIY